MNTDYTYCLSEECIHRRGCIYSIVNEFNDVDIANFDIINSYDCITDHDIEDKYGNPIPTAYNHLDRFRYSDGREFE